MKQTIQSATEMSLGKVMLVENVKEGLLLSASPSILTGQKGLSL